MKLHLYVHNNNIVILGTKTNTHNISGFTLNSLKGYGTFYFSTKWIANAFKTTKLTDISHLLSDDIVTKLNELGI